MYGYEVLILVGQLKDATRLARLVVDGEDLGFIVLDQGDELWYGHSEVEIVSEPSEMDCE